MQGTVNGLKNEVKAEQEARGARLAGGVAFEGVTTNLQMRKLTRSESRNSLSTMAPAVQNRGGARQQVAAVSRLVVRRRVCSGLVAGEA